METKKDLTKFIEQYMKFYAEPAVIARGKLLYDDGNVFPIEYDEKLDIWRFSVLGSTKYNVLVKGIKKKEVSTSCTCPFDWGTVCKHTIAALCYISNVGYDHAPTSPDKQSAAQPEKKPEENYEITNYKNLSNEWIKVNSQAHIFSNLRYYLSNYSLTKLLIKTDEIIFVLSISNRTCDVHFKRIDDRVYVSSSERRTKNKLVESEIFCLLQISESEEPSFLETLFTHSHLEKEKHVLATYGLPEDTDFSEYFSYSYSKRGVEIFYTDNSDGLLPLTDEFTAEFSYFIHDVNDDTLALSQIKGASETRELAFSFDFATDYYGYKKEMSKNPYFPVKQQIGISAFTAKPNKAGNALISNFKPYEEFDCEEFSIANMEEHNATIELLDLLEHTTDQAKEFELMQQIFQKLCTKPFVFKRETTSFSIKKNQLEKLTMSSTPVECLCEVSTQKGFVQSQIKIKIGDRILKDADTKKMQTNYQIFILDNVCYCAKNYKVTQLLSHTPIPLKMVKEHKNLFFEKVISPISINYPVAFTDKSYKINTVELDFHKKQIYLSEQNDYIIFTLQVVYDNNTSVLLHHDGEILVNNNEKVHEYKRNVELENEFVAETAEMHPLFAAQMSEKRFVLHKDEFIKGMWFYKFFDQLVQNNIEVFGFKNLKNFKYSPYKGKISTSIASGQDWFEVEVNVSFGDNTVSINDIKKAVLNHEQYVQLKDGSVGILPKEWMHKLEKYFRNGEIKKDKLEISKLRFSIIDELFDNISDAEIIEEIQQKQARLSTFTEISNTTVPKQIKASLRHYQKEGLNWLNFLDEMQWGGILADDMGLGKTLQILTFIQHLVNKKHCTNLIVLPTTLLFNWENEIKKFAPKLKALYHYGTDRIKEIKQFDKYHIVFTSYGVLLRDIEWLKDFRFNYVILDESQAIKNPSSRRYKAANLLQSENRIALTGTPIENSTFDLFAQMNFVNRGFLGGVTAFRERYSNPIDKDGNEAIAAELQRVVNPFILRRTKEKVASELPTKTEDIIYCEMESEQRKVYDAYRNEYRDQLLNKISEDGLGKSKLMVLEALTRLRQICDSPALLKLDELTTNESIKIKEIIRHITKKTAKHKILIFSQFVTMLEILKGELDKLNISYEYLDGKSSTQQRQNSVNAFQENEDLRVFLISLKAGGTGLNLTAADYVYILDPWWNPAVENQAIDRCYRIGQDKKVFAYRMICKDTVEEKIVKLQEKKKKLAEDIIQTDENIMKAIEVDDIRDLFS